MVVHKSADETHRWLVEHLAKMLDMDPATIDPDKPVQRYGLDSAAAVELMSDLSDWLKVELEPTVIFEHRTIRSLAEHVASAAAGSAS